MIPFAFKSDEIDDFFDTQPLSYIEFETAAVQKPPKIRLIITLL